MMFQIGDKVVPNSSAGIFGAIRKAEAINQPFLYIVSITNYPTYWQCGVSHHPHFYSGDVSYVGAKELTLYDESETVENIINKQHRIGKLRLKIDESLENNDKAAFMQATQELKEVTSEQGEHD